MPNEVQTISFSPAPTAGSYTLTFYGQTTTALDWNDPAATIQAALEALSTIGTGNLSVSGEADSGEIELTFQGGLANVNVPQSTCDASGLSCAGSIGAVSETTAGSGPTDVPATDATAIGTLVIGSSGNWPNGGYWQLGSDNYGTSPTGYWDSGVTGSGQSSPSPFNALTMSDPADDGGQVSWDGTISVDFTDGTNDSTTGSYEVQAIPAPSATGGTFTVAWTAEPTGDLAFNITQADLQTALNSLPDVSAAGGVSVTGTDGGPWIVTWNNWGPQALLTVDGTNLTNGVTATPSTTEQGGPPAAYGSVLKSAMISCEKDLRMSYKPDDNYYGLVTTRRIDIGALSDADFTPSAAAYHNGSLDSSFALAVASLGSGSGCYTVSGTIPGGYQKGDVVQILVTATVNGVTDAAPIDSMVIDSKRVGDLQDASVAAIQSGLMPAASYIAPDNADIAAIKAKTDNLPAQPAAVGSKMDLVDSPNATASAALAVAAWNSALSALTTAGSIGAKLAAWVLGSDDKVLLSGDPQTGVTIPTVSQVTSGVELDSSQDIYPADIEFVPNDSDGLDEYTVAWFHNGTPLTAGITSPTIEVTQRLDGTDLVSAGTAMIAVGSSGLLKYDEPTNRLDPGATAIVTVTATIDGAARTWRRLVMRADS